MILERQVLNVAVGKTLETFRIGGTDKHGLQVSVEIPILTVNGQNGSGARVLFTGGIHGDEYEGPYALYRLIHEIDARELCGTVVIAPNLNPSAIVFRRRESPFDQRDLNRSFPGDPNGDITEAIAAFMTAELLPAADIVIDLHAAGDECDCAPGPLGHFVQDKALQEKTIALMEAFSAPCTLLMDEEESLTMWDFQVEKAGKIFFTVELGGAGALTLESMEISWRGVVNSLIHLGIKDGPPIPFKPWRGWEKPKLLRVFGPENFADFPHAGFFAPAVDPGALLEPGNAIGNIMHTDTPLSLPTPVESKIDGYLYARSTGGYVNDPAWWMITAAETEWGTAAYDKSA